MNNCTLESSTGSDADCVFLYYDHLLFVLEEPGHHVTDQLDSKQTLVTLILHFQKEGSHNLSSLRLFIVPQLNILYFSSFLEHYFFSLDSLTYLPVLVVGSLYLIYVLYSF